MRDVPEILPLLLNAAEHFVDMPDIVQAALSVFKPTSIGSSKLQAPLTNRFVGEHDVRFDEQFFDLRETQAEPMVQPDGVTDDLRWKTKTAVAGYFVFITPVCQTPVNLTIPSGLLPTLWSRPVLPN